MKECARNLVRGTLINFHISQEDIADLRRCTRVNTRRDNKDRVRVCVKARHVSTRLRKEIPLLIFITFGSAILVMVSYRRHVAGGIHAAISAGIHLYIIYVIFKSGVPPVRVKVRFQINLILMIRRNNFTCGQISALLNVRFIGRFRVLRATSMIKCLSKLHGKIFRTSIRLQLSGLTTLNLGRRCAVNATRAVSNANNDVLRRKGKNSFFEISIIRQALSTIRRCRQVNVTDGTASAAGPRIKIVRPEIATALGHGRAKGRAHRIIAGQATKDHNGFNQLCVNGKTSREDFLLHSRTRCRRFIGNYRVFFRDCVGRSFKTCHCRFVLGTGVERFW